MARPNKKAPVLGAGEMFNVWWEAGRVREETLSLKALTASRDFQARAKMNMAHVRLLANLRRMGATLEPIVVVFDAASGKYYTCDGAHRSKEAEKAGDKEIRAYVIDGTKQDAIEFAAQANKRLSLARTAADTKRAAWMLFAIEEWWVRSDRMIAAHVGVSPITMGKYRRQWCKAKGVALPDVVVGGDGKSRVRPALPGEAAVKTSISPDGRVSVRRGDEVASVGRVENVSKEKLAEAMDKVNAAYAEKTGVIDSKDISSIARLRSQLDLKGIPSETGRAGSQTVPAVGCEGFSVVGVDNGLSETFYGAVGRVLLHRHQVGGHGRPVIICHAYVAPWIKKLVISAGVEVMSLDAFVAEYQKSKVPPAVPARAGSKSFSARPKIACVTLGRKAKNSSPKSPKKQTA